jgi:HlyD family secretion protein
MKTNLHSTSTDHTVTGSAMDRVVPKRRGKKWLMIAIGISIACIAAYSLFKAMPQGFPAKQDEMRIATVEKGIFLDNISVRASAEALNSVMLDSMETGRVEEVIAQDGMLVKKGDVLFRLSNTQRHLELLQRQSEYTQQITNRSMLRASLETSRTDYLKRIADGEFQVNQAKKLLDRQKSLSQQGFISTQSTEEAQDKYALQVHLLENLKNAQQTEIKLRSDAVNEVEKAITRLQTGLQLVSATVAALEVRAPRSGRLTDFHLQVGEIVKLDHHLGHIDEPDRYKLKANVDEYYISRTAVGQQAEIKLKEKSYIAKITRVFPQIKEGRFSIELEFVKDHPSDLSPGRSIDVHITLGEPAPALLLPNDSFVNDSGGAWVFVVSSDGKSAEKRTIQIGRRSHNQIEVISGLNPNEKVVVSSYAPYGKAERLAIQKASK